MELRLWIFTHVSALMARMLDHTPTMVLLHMGFTFLISLALRCVMCSEKHLFTASTWFSSVDGEIVVHSRLNSSDRLDIRT
jgi:hypothetical protein